jgi:ligand-binding sensor domain-containing protein
MEIKDNVVYAVSGGATDIFGDLFRRDGFYILQEGNWSNFNENNVSQIKDNELLSFLKVAAHPVNDKVYFGTFWAGILEWDFATNEIQVFDESNSSLQGAQGDEARERITSLIFDKENNLWVSNYNAPKPISVLTNEGVWHSFDVISDEKLSQMTVDQNGYKWAIVFGNNGGVLVYDDNGTINDPTDDLQKLFTVANSAISSNIINSIEVDLEGDVWVGTSQGPIVFECGGGVFDAACQGTKRKVVQDSIVAFLLENENINTIAVDGANRKWFGSRNGIFVQSPSGENEIFRFTINNSPLFDNNILDLKFNPENGEMYIATDKGLQSIRTNSTSGTKSHKSEVYAYPNPVRPDYRGPIAIKGLARDSNVKITDIKGKLIYETTALGGQAIWDGNNFSGRRAASGVYLVFNTSSESFDNPDTVVTKILIVN